MWKDDYTGNIYKDKEEAMDVVRAEIEIEDIIDYGNFSLYDLLKLCLKHCPDEIYDEITEAEENYFDDRFYELEEDE